MIPIKVYIKNFSFQLNGAFEIKKTLLMFFSFFYQYPIKTSDVSMVINKNKYIFYNNVLCMIS